MGHPIKHSWSLLPLSKLTSKQYYIAIPASTTVQSSIVCLESLQGIRHEACHVTYQLKMSSLILLLDNQRTKSRILAFHWL